MTRPPSIFPFEQSPLLAGLPADLRDHLIAQAERADYPLGAPLFYQGDPSARVGLLIDGRVALKASGQSRGAALPGDLLDPAATLGKLPHTVSAQAETACAVLWWPTELFDFDPALRDAARQFLGRTLQTSQARLAELSTPIHAGAAASVTPGPFRFDQATLLLAFCEADSEPLAATLPPEVSLLTPAGSPRAPLLIGLANFPEAYPEHDPLARFAYTETTIFAPVRAGATPGVFIPWIYPSAWEPILIGREVYGFPKLLGETVIEARAASLRVDGTERARLSWESLELSDEAALVGALMAWLGIERTAASLAFRAGDALRAAAGLPAHRRVDVFNRKRVPAASATSDAPAWDVDQLTHAVFGVLRWENIARMKGARLEIAGEPLAGLNATLREAHRTRLDMRLSAGKIARDYLRQESAT